MDKKVTTISIDMLLFRKAKREIPNLSEFVEKCLRVYLNASDNEDNVESIQVELNKIKEARLKIHLLSESDLNEDVLIGFDSQKMNKAWRKIWSSYRSINSYQEDDLKEAVTILGKSANELVNMMQSLIYNVRKSDLSKCDEWETALSVYKDI